MTLDQQPPSGQGRLVAVVVTYNRLAQLQVTVERLLSSPSRDLAALVVLDNASTDGTAAWLAGLDDPRLQVQRAPRNEGGAGGFARGMAYAMEHCAPDWLLLMDDDGRPEPETLARFHAADLTGTDGVATAVYTDTGEICDMNRPSKNPFWHRDVFWRTLRNLGRRNGFHLVPEDYAGKELVEIDITSFVGFFVRATTVAQRGYPDPALFLYGDDGLYTFGLRQAGHRVVFDPKLRFEHAISTFQDGRFRPLWKVYYYHRNLLLLYREAAGWKFWLLLGIVLPKWLMRTRAHQGERGAFLRLLGRAIFDGLTRRLDVDHATIVALGEGGQGGKDPAA